MRTIIPISLPESLAKEVRREVRVGKFASTSEFFRHLIRLHNTESLARDIIHARQEKKYRELKSIKDLE